MTLHELAATLTHAALQSDEVQRLREENRQLQARVDQLEVRCGITEAAWTETQIARDLKALHELVEKQDRAIGERDRALEAAFAELKQLKEQRAVAQIFNTEPT